jgi:hypothetical protein
MTQTKPRHIRRGAIVLSQAGWYARCGATIPWRIGHRSIRGHTEVGATFMKLTPVLMLAAGIIITGAFVNSQGYAQLSKDDVKWINQCIADNKGQPGGTPDIVRKYCMCMNEEMDDNETRSVSQFEKANPKIRAKCDKQSGWK